MQNNLISPKRESTSHARSTRSPIAQIDPVEVENRLEANLSNSFTLLNEAKAYDPDFICFSEFILQLRFDHDGLVCEDVVQPIPGRATDAVGEKTP